jgi:hypothetical protein
MVIESIPRVGHLFCRAALFVGGRIGSEVEVARKFSGEKSMNAWKRITLTCLSLLVLGLVPIGTAVAQVKVTAANPSSAYQGTISLDVTVSGSGFDPTAKVRYLVSGTTDPGGIVVKNVKFNGSKELVTTIDVADNATAASFDIEVTLDSGRKGKGTTLFSVTSRSSSKTTAYVGQNLGTLPGDKYSDAWDVNTDGRVVGRSYSGSVRAFYWKDAMYQLPMSADSRNTPPFSVAWDVEATGISGGPAEVAVGYEDRSVCETRNGPCDHAQYPIVWEGDLSKSPEAVRLDTAGGSAAGINQAGTIAVGACGGGAGAFWERSGGTWVRNNISLSAFECAGCEYDWGMGRDVNDAGIVVGLVSRKSDYLQFAYVYDTRSLRGRILPIPPVYQQSNAYAVGNVTNGKVHVAGVVIPCSDMTCAASRAIRWTVDIDTLAVSFEVLDQLNWAQGVTDQGVVAGTHNSKPDRRGNVIQTAMLWSELAGYTSLLPASGGTDSTSRSMAAGANGPVYVVGETNSRGAWTAVRWVIP